MLQCRVVVEAAAVVLFVLCSTDEDMSVPFVREIAHVGNGDVHALVLAALDEGGETVMIASDVDELPMVFTAYRFQVVDVFCLKIL